MALLDRTDLIGNLFFPRTDEAPSPANATDYTVAVSGAALHLRIHNGPPGAGIVLMFHGNGEIVSDWNAAASDFAEHGFRLAVVDYRGYGRSTGTPTIRTLLSDANAVLDYVAATFADPLVVMGRSLGSAAAWQAIAHAAQRHRVCGVVIDSGFVSVDAFAQRRGLAPQAIDADARRALDPMPKLATVTCPVLLLHGERDAAIAITEAVAAFEALTCPKQLVRLAGRGHNDLSWHPDYWAKLGAFLHQCKAAD